MKRLLRHLDRSVSPYLTHLTVTSTHSPWPTYCSCGHAHTCSTRTHKRARAQLLWLNNYLTYCHCLKHCSHYLCIKSSGIQILSLLIFEILSHNPATIASLPADNTACASIVSFLSLSFFRSVIAKTWLIFCTSGPFHFKVSPQPIACLHLILCILSLLKQPTCRLSLWCPSSWSWPPVWQH